MNKLGIWAIVVAGAFFLGVLTANPVVEAVGGWKGAFDGLDTRIIALENQPAPESQIYEVSGVSIIQSGTSAGSLVQLRCLDGDTFIDGERNTVFSLDSSMSFPVQRSDFIQVFESVPDIDGSSARVIGADVRARGDGGIPTFDVPVTITGLCLSPSP